MSGYRLVTTPTPIPIPGNKLIEEYFGAVTTGTRAFSVAHMIAPPGWTEPPQTPEFGELTIVLRGRLRVSAEGEDLALEAGQVLWTAPGTRVQYGNASDAECEYWAICMPAFTPDSAHREGS